MDLKELRESIDGIDGEIVRLFEERMKLSARVAEVKLRTGKAVFDSRREEEKLRSVRNQLQDGENEKGVTDLFEMLMHLSRRKQYEVMATRGISPHLSFKPVDALPL